MLASKRSELLTAFAQGRVDPASFSHRDHVRVSYELLAQRRFPEALLHLARGLRRLAAKAGKPEIYHETMTAAFLALIAERSLGKPCASWEEFEERNPDLFRKDLLERFYRPDVLQSALARQTFVLPGSTAS
ncbi:MAG: hypothetical protein ACR2G0_03665 [Chthoniobacterales bacterium]